MSAWTMERRDKCYFPHKKYHKSIFLDKKAWNVISHHSLSEVCSCVALANTLTLTPSQRHNMSSEQAFIFRKQDETFYILCISYEASQRERAGQFEILRRRLNVQDIMIP